MLLTAAGTRATGQLRTPRTEQWRGRAVGCARQLPRTLGKQRGDDAKGFAARPLHGIQQIALLVSAEPRKILTDLRLLHWVNASQWRCRWTSRCH
jgi:hypothetical protein